MTYSITIELKAADTSVEEIKETLNVDLPESSFYEYKIIVVEEKKK